MKAPLLSIEDVCATRTERGKLQWKAPNKIFKYWYEGPMVHFDNKCVDQLVTPDHRMVGRRVKWSPVRLREKYGSTIVGKQEFAFAKEVAKLPKLSNAYRFQIPIACDGWRGNLEKAQIVIEAKDGGIGRPSESYSVNIWDWVAFLGIYAAEGSARFSLSRVEKSVSKNPKPLYVQAMAAAAYEIERPVSSNEYGVCIGQMPSSKHWKDIRDLLDRLPWAYSIKRNGFVLNSKALWQTVIGCGNAYTKSVPDWVKQLPVEYLEHFLTWAMKGDGHTYPTGSRMYATVSEVLANDIQEIMFKIGKGSGINVIPSKKMENGRWSAPAYLVFEHKTTWAGVGDADTVPYQGYVYCAAVPPNETLYVRRNGKASWTGNTPYNLRRFSETPIPRRAINLIKNAVLSLRWEIQPVTDQDNNQVDPEVEKRVTILTENLKRPNNVESFREVMEAMIEDMLLGGYGVLEPRMTPYPQRPFKMWCYSKDTEVLTKRGWLCWSEVKQDDYLATRRADGTFEWHHPSQLLKTKYKGKMIGFIGKGVDLLVTPNHRMLGRRYYGRVRANGVRNKVYGDIGFTIASDVATLKNPESGTQRPFQIPATSVWNGKNPVGKKIIQGIRRGKRLRYEVDWMDWCAFLGIYLAEGSVSGSHHGIKKSVADDHRTHFVQAIAAAADTEAAHVGSNNVYISQVRHSKHYSAIKKMLGNLPWSFGTEKRGHFRVGNIALHRELWPLGNKYTKYIPDEIKSLPKHYLEKLVEWMVKGDGSVNDSGRFFYYTSSKRLADDLQEVVQKIGKTASIDVDRRQRSVMGRSKGRCAPVYCVRELVSEFFSIGKASAIISDYDDDVYCASVPNGTLYVRRNGKAQWCGNSVDGSTIRIFMDWTESVPDRPRFAQMTGLKGERGIVTFLDSELIYIRDNVRTSTPFGMGKLEVCFNAVNAFLGVQDMSARAGADQVHKTWLWWSQTINPSRVQEVRRHIQNELEGQAKVSLIAGLQKPEVVEVTPVTQDDLLLEWQKFLIDIIANGFDLSPMSLGQTDKVNKATGQVMADSDFRSSVVPMARRVEEGITRHLIHNFLQWKDLEFKFIDLDDPDALTRTIIQQREYMMNAITPDEIRKKNNMPPLPGGWGKLTSSQLQLLTAAQIAQMTGKGMGAGMSSGMGGMSRGMTSGMGGGMGMGNSGMDSTMGSGSMNFSVDDISTMTPDQIQLFQEFGILPPTQQLGQQMEQQQPGVLETLTDELQQFFQHLEVVEEEDEQQEAPITSQDMKEQKQKFAEAEHQEDLSERVINRRGIFGPSINDQTRKNPIRGKYPRSGGAFTPPQDTPDITGKPKKNYRPGRKNPYK